MKTDFNFFKAVMPATRQAQYQMGCLGGSVFLDFNCHPDKRIHLVRISFDGYGCCRLGAKAKGLKLDLSQKFIQEMEKEELDQVAVAGLVKESIRINRRMIWRDALKKYNLIEPTRLARLFRQ